jgi:hypothetical protein
MIFINFSEECLENGVDYKGGDLYGTKSFKSYEMVSSPAQCQATCRKTPLCTLWTWGLPSHKNLTSRMCFLKSKNHTRVIDYLAISGTKNCPGKM